jgi:hypothetical protein
MTTLSGFGKYVLVNAVKTTPPLGSRGGGGVSRGCIAQQEKGHFFRDRDVRSLYRTGSLTAAARELARYKLDLVGVQEVRWDKEGTVRAEDYIFFYATGF